MSAIFYDPRESKRSAIAGVAIGILGGYALLGLVIIMIATFCFLLGV